MVVSVHVRKQARGFPMWRNVAPNGWAGATLGKQKSSEGFERFNTSRIIGEGAIHRRESEVREFLAKLRVPLRDKFGMLTFHIQERNVLTSSRQ